MESEHWRPWLTPFCYRKKPCLVSICCIFAWSEAQKAKVSHISIHIYPEFVASHYVAFPGRTVKLLSHFIRISSLQLILTKTHSVKGTTHISHLHWHAKISMERKGIWGLFQLEWLKSELKHKFKQKVKNVSINRKHSLTRMLILCLLKLSKIKVLYVSQTIAMFYKNAKHNIIGWSKGQGHINKRGNFFSSELLWLEAIITKPYLGKKYWA